MFTIAAGTFCGGEDCTILSDHAGLEFENGTKGDVSGLPRPPKTGAGFVGVSDDNGDEPLIYGTKDGSIENGYWMSKTDSVGVWADFVNLDKEEKKPYLSYDCNSFLDMLAPTHKGPCFQSLDVL